jgi:hypothetical protein
VKQNLTLSLDKDLIKKAKILAAHHETSITGLLAAYIQKMAAEEQFYQESKVKALEAMEKGLAFGGKRSSRESLHER